MPDLKVLKDACDAAEAAKAELVTERRANREAMSPRAFLEYNDATRAKQKAIQATVDSCDNDFREALKVIRSDAVDRAIRVAVGTVDEGNSGVELGNG